MEENNIIKLKKLYNFVKHQEISLVNKIKVYYNILLGIENTNNEIDTIDEINEIDTIDEINEIDTIYEINENNTIDEINEINENNTIDEINEINTIDEINEINTIDEIDNNINNSYKKQEILNEYLNILSKYIKIKLLDDNENNIIINNIKIIEDNLLLNFKNIYELLFNSSMNRNRLIDIYDNYNKINVNILITNNIISIENKKILIDIHKLHKNKYLELCHNQELPIGCLINKINKSDECFSKHSYNYCYYGCELCESYEPFIEYYYKNNKDHFLSKIKIEITLLSGNNIVLDCNYHIVTFYDIYYKINIYFRDNNYVNPIKNNSLKLFYKNNLIFTYISGNHAIFTKNPCNTKLCETINYLIDWKELENTNILNLEIICYNQNIHDNYDDKIKETYR